jgi:hypothetical protein
MVTRPVGGCDTPRFCASEAADMVKCDRSPFSSTSYRVDGKLMIRIARTRGMRRCCWTDSNICCDAIVTYVTMKRIWTSDRGARRVEIEGRRSYPERMLGGAGVLFVRRDISLSG